MTFPAYPAYKDSGDEWLGKVPEHWQALALSRVLAAPVTDGPHTTPEFLDDGVPFLSVDGIQDGKLNFEGCRYVSFEDHKEFSKKAAPRHNDLLMGKAASVGKIARVTEDIEFSIWSPLALIRVDAGQCSPEFLEFCLKSSELQHQVLLASNSNTQLNIGMKDIPKLRIPLPTAQEQTQIARFLDHETARIDALIEEQQRLIELLKEKRQAVISHAVTKGLDPTVPMKDSGVEWLGEVPAHWTVAPIKFFFEFLDGQRIPIKAEDRGAMQGDYPYYGASGIIDYVNDFIFEEDLVLVSEDGANLLMRSTPIAFVAQGKYWVNNHAHIIRPQDESLTYWAEVIEQQDLTNYVTGSAQPKLTAEALGSIKIAVPPTGSERAAIQAFILEIDAELGALLSEAACGVRLLQERRSALISAAVTGKIDVRDWQPQASAQAPELALAEAN